MSALPALVSKPSICFVGLDNLPVLAREYNHHYIGGEPVQQTLLARAFARRGYNVSMVIADYGQDDGATWDGVRTFKAYGKSQGLPIARFVHPRWTGLWAALKRADADVYYTSCASAQVGQIAMFCRKHGRKFIFRSASDADCEPDRVLIKYWRDKMLYAYGLKRADGVLTQSLKQQRTMQDKYGVPSTVAGMLVETGEVRPFSQRDISMLWVSNLRPLKRPELFLNLSERQPDLSAHMVGGAMGGDTHLFEQTRARAERMPQMSFHGRVPYHDAGALYERARVLVNTSDIEGFPNTYLQAWGCGVPVVAFFDPDNVIAREGLGYAVKNLDEMQAAVRELAHDEFAWRAASTRCRTFMQGEFGEATVVDSYARAIERATGRATS